MKQETGRLKEILHVLNQHNVTHGINPEKLCSILEDLGPTYVKLGQIMSMRSDILPEKYCHELARLRTDVKPMSFNEIWKILNKELHNDPGQLFQKINQIPVGCASIAQVHEAVLGDGSKVVLKIQRPQIKQIMAEDIALLKKASGFLNFATGTSELIDFRKVIDELWETSKEEMDFEKEAQHLERFYENQKDVAYVTCPKVYKEYSNEHLLVMSYVDGIQIDHIEELDRNGYDRKEIAQKTAQNYCKQILADGFFHADPHPGNLWISGGQIVWLDLGMAGDLSEHYRAIMKRAITAILKNDIYELKNAFLSFGKPTEKIDHASLYTDLDDMVGKYMNMDFGTMDLGELMEEGFSEQTIRSYSFKWQIAKWKSNIRYKYKNSKGKDIGERNVPVYGYKLSNVRSLGLTVNDLKAKYNKDDNNITLTWTDPNTIETTREKNVGFSIYVVEITGELTKVGEVDKGVTKYLHKSLDGRLAYDFVVKPLFGEDKVEGAVSNHAPCLYHKCDR